MGVIASVQLLSQVEVSPSGKMTVELAGLDGEDFAEAVVTSGLCDDGGRWQGARRDVVPVVSMS